MQKKLPRRLGEKLILSILCLITFLFFSNDFSLVDIQKTAIVLAAGIDRANSGDYEVTAVIAKLQSSESGSSSPSESTVKGTGKTVADAVRHINTQIGQLPKFPFCDLVILGEKVTEEDVFSVLGYFIRNEYSSDNCLLAMCRGTAADLLGAKLPLEDMLTEGLKKILSSETKKSGNVSAINLKDFSAKHYAEGKSAYMPCLTLEGEGEQTTIDATRIALFHEGKRVELLEEEDGFTFNLLCDCIRMATLKVPVGDKSFALGLKSIKSNTEIQTKNDLPVLKISLSARAQINDCSAPQSIAEMTNYLYVPPEVLKAAEESLQERFIALFEKTRAKNCDLFHAVDKLKKKSPRLYQTYKNGLLERITPQVDIKISDRS